ncbi:MAG: hypothetical protein HKN46_08330 [Acidimicrobiia bacterium]|nr:hypothetical protein [Acidimicrobiia bacterium]
MPGVPVADHEHVEVTTRAELRAWLEGHHTQPESIWLVTYKKSTRPDLHLPWEDIVQEALCFGWIDSQAKKVDDERTKVRLSPRKRGSIWSAINKAHIVALEEQGLMTDAGRARIEAAKQDGSWEFLDDVEAGTVPDDLAAALAAQPGARETFDGFPWSTRRSTLAWIKMAKRPETRAKRIAEAAEKCARGIRPV